MAGAYGNWQSCSCAARMAKKGFLWCLCLQLEENMMRAFHHFDTDNSGTISKEELKAALKVPSCSCRTFFSRQTFAWHQDRVYTCHASIGA